MYDVLAMTTNLEIILDSLKDTLEIGEWDCPKSPIFLCAYNWRSYIKQDSCIYCGEPDERK